MGNRPAQHERVLPIHSALLVRTVDAALTVLTRREGRIMLTPWQIQRDFVRSKEVELSRVARRASQLADWRHSRPRRRVVSWLRRMFRVGHTRASRDHPAAIPVARAEPLAASRFPPS